METQKIFFNSTFTIDSIRNSLPYNTVSIEYPGYSIYYQEKSSKIIEEDALIVFDYFVSTLRVNPYDIVVCGRSIGSGPATYLAANRNPAALILVSPFKSIRETVGSIAGIMKYLVAERFNNLKTIKKVTCPTLIIHGQRDKLIPYTHSIELSKNCGGPFDLVFPEKMDHNDFSITDDFLEPVYSFMKRQNLLSCQVEDEGKKDIPKELFDIPDYYYLSAKQPNKDMFTHFLRKVMKIY